MHTQAGPATGSEIVTGKEEVRKDWVRRGRFRYGPGKAAYIGEVAEHLFDDSRLAEAQTGFKLMTTEGEVAPAIEVAELISQAFPV